MAARNSSPNISATTRDVLILLPGLSDVLVNLALSPRPARSTLRSLALRKPSLESNRFPASQYYSVIVGVADSAARISMTSGASRLCSNSFIITFMG